jgi:acyl-lipid omega-6 desaturase (Delta-12 desaturase)
VHPTTSPAVANRRAEKELLIASKAFAVENRAASWRKTFSTFGICIALCAAAVFSPTWPIRLSLSLVLGLTLVRAFCLFHDFQHGAILRQSPLATGLYWVFGQFILTPASVWKETHNYHHAHTAKVIGSHIGSYPVVTTSMWKEMTPAQRVLYRLARHPLNMLLSIFTVFSIGMCVRPFVRAPQKHWSGLLSFVVNYGLGALALFTGHLDAWIFGWLIPMAVAASTGSYLFYVQHNFPEGHIANRQTWTFSGAALDSSSYMKMGPVMNWFTANIGYHHVHHLNAAIPFYRLPEAMAAIDELKQPGTTSWSPSDIAACFRLKLWDADKNEMVGYPSSAP